MGRITKTFQRAREQGRAVVAPYFTVGYPDVDATLEGIRAAIRAGADLIELGVPFSDPLADGATIQKSSTAALNNGVTLQTCLETTEKIRAEFPETPIILMGYYNPFFQYGIDKLTQDAAEAGADGLIVPDLPPEESGPLDEVISQRGLDLIYMVAPTSPDERIRLISERARGFVYCVSLTGVTGARDSVSANVPDLISRVRAHTNVPLVLGFGISRPEHVASVASIVDGVAIGSAMVNIMGETAPSERAEVVGNYVRSLAEAARRAEGSAISQSTGGGL